jgi:purine-binding chemotaxis protein CheW
MTDQIHALNRTERELISFRISEQEFCVDIMSVREIRGWTQATPLPRTPSFVRGVINLRGAVLPVIDLGSRLGLQTDSPTERHVIIVTRIGEQMVGLLVDAVCDIIAVTDTLIQATPDVASDLVDRFVRGIFSLEGRMISLVALDRVLPDLEAEAA